MNRAARRAEARSLLKRGAGWTRPVCHRSLKQIETQGRGARKHQTVVDRIGRGDLPVRRSA